MFLVIFLILDVCGSFKQYQKLYSFSNNDAEKMIPHVEKNIIFENEIFIYT